MDRHCVVYQMELTLVLIVVLFWVAVWADDSKIISDRYAVYWNSTNPRFVHGEYTVEVAINDYLDIYCPHYETPLPPERMERYILYMVSYDSYITCNHLIRGFKRWECNRPLSPSGPLKFSEKFQLFTPFSLGFEFRPGHEYYYISSPHPNLAGKPCLKLRVYVKPTSEPVKAFKKPQYNGNTVCTKRTRSRFDDSLYESPEPFLTDDSNSGHFLSPCLFLLLLTLLLLFFGSS